MRGNIGSVKDFAQIGLQTLAESAKNVITCRHSTSEWLHAIRAFFFSPTSGHSLYIILVSQITSIATTLFTKTVPEFEWLWLVLMVAGGIGGGVVGWLLNKRIDNKQVEKLFVILMFVIIGISFCNTWVFMK